MTKQEEQQIAEEEKEAEKQASGISEALNNMDKIENFVKETIKEI